MPVVMKPLEDEIWAELRLLGVEAVALRILRRRFPSRSEGTLKPLATKMASCVRQADEYFWLAVEAPQRVAPLLHYYSMLNLAKALLFLDSPERLQTRGDFRHGLGDPHAIKDAGHYSLPAETVKVARRGIFPSLFAVLTGTDLPAGAEYRLADLLRYCAWISVEMGEVYGVASRLVAGEFQLAIDSHRRAAWVVVEIPRSELSAHCGSVTQFRTEVPAFFSVFHRVAAEPETLRFECDPVTFSGPRWIQRSVVSLRERVRQLRLYRHLVVSELSGAGGYFVPFQLDGADPLPEACVLYAVGFYLGSLVRYQPHIYEAMLGKEEAWITEAFIRQCPTCFSHIMLNHLWRREHVFCRG